MKRTFFQANWTPGNTADGSTLAAGYMALKGGAATYWMDILEIMIEGLAGSSSPTALVLGYDSTVGATPTALATPNTDGPNNPLNNALANAPVAYVAATTNPTRSNSTSLPKLSLGLNAFGGFARYNTAPGQQFSVSGNAASVGEVSLSGVASPTGAGVVQSHILYEVA